MDAQIKTEQIVSNNDYTLELSTQGTTITLKLTIKVSKLKTEIYQITLNSLDDVDGLAKQFGKSDLFLKYIQDPNNIQVNLQLKTIVVIQYTTRRRQIVPIVSLPLQFVNSIQKNPQQELVEQILDRCSSKVQLSGQEIKSFLENIAMCLGQNIKHKKQNKTQIQAQEEQIRNLEDQVTGNWAKCQERSHIKSECLNKMKEIEDNLSQNIEQASKQVKDYFQNRITQMLSSHNKEINEKMANMEEKWSQNLLIMSENLQKQLDRLEEQKANKKQIEQMNKQFNDEVNKQIQKIKKVLERDIYVLGHRLQKVEKILEKMESSLKENTEEIQKVEYTANQLEKKEKKRYPAENWVDPECYDFNNLVLSGSTITAKEEAFVFGKENLVGQCQFTVKFTKIGNYVGLGINDTQNKDKSSGNWNNNSVCYLSNDNCYVSGKTVGNFGSGFKVGQTVTVAIDLNLGSIQWKVGEQVRHQVTNDMLKDKKINWVPYIFLRQDDSVELME